MKKPYLTQHERWVLKYIPDSAQGAAIRLDIAKREFCREMKKGIAKNYIKLIIIWLVVMVLAIIFLSCEKSEIEPVQNQQQFKYEIKYWVHSDSAFIRYKVNDDFFKHYVLGHWDTTYYADSGDMMLTVTCWDFPMNCGYSVNGCAIDVASNVDFFQSDFKLP